MPRRVALTVCLAALMVATPATAQQMAEPTGRHVAYGADPATTMSVTFTGPPADEATVSYGVHGVEATVDAESQPIPGSERHVYRANLTGLEPGTTYTYQVTLDSTSSNQRVFTTAPEPGANRTLTLTAYGDHGTDTRLPEHPGIEVERANGDAPTRVMELAKSLEPTFHVTVGDLAYARGNARWWDEHFDDMAPFYGATPTMTVPGNHEREAGTGFLQYDRHVTMPNSSMARWWSVQIGHTALIGLNSETACDATPPEAISPGPGHNCEYADTNEPEPTQLAFLRSSLKAAAEDPSVTWIVVATHNPVYSSSSGHGSTQGLIDHWVPLFDTYGVDVVLQGHDHVYERTHPMTGGTVTSEGGTVYLTNGAAGSDHYGLQEEAPEWSAARNTGDFGVLELELGEAAIEGRFVSLENGTLDRFTLTKRTTGVAAGTTGTPGEETDEEGTEATPAPSAGLIASLAALAALAARRREG